MNAADRYSSGADTGGMALWRKMRGLESSESKGSWGYPRSRLLESAQRD